MQEDRGAEGRTGMEGRPEEAGTARPSGKSHKKRAALVIFIILAIVAAVAAFFYIQYKKTHISTDDAFIDGNVHTIAPKVAGTVKTIFVNDNQFVNAGDVLVELDPVDYDTRVQQAQSGFDAEKKRAVADASVIQTARRKLAEQEAAVAAARAELGLQQATMDQAARDAKRAAALYRQEALPRERYEQAGTAYEVAKARVMAAREQLRKAQAAVLSQKAVVRQTEAALDLQHSVINQQGAALDIAMLNAGYTRIVAPTDGFVTKKSVEVGNQVQPGQPLMAIVPLSDVWVTANYKETQLAHVRPGQKVDMEVDAYPGKKFRGYVNSIMSGTGASFSLFPPENATGNYVKVVQRVPVKIVFAKGEIPAQGGKLKLGMSVVPTILVK